MTWRVTKPKDETLIPCARCQRGYPLWQMAQHGGEWWCPWCEGKGEDDDDL